MTTGQKVGIVLVILAYVIATGYVKLGEHFFGKKVALSVAIVGAFLLIIDEPANAG